MSDLYTELLDIRGAGKVYDFRKGRLSRPNGGVINVLLGVHHIPVIHNRKGIPDLITLGQVLIDQGLMVQFGTDDNGHVAIFTDPNRLCYQARGVNSFSLGVEHMHWAVDEPWQRDQLRAAAWVYQYTHRKVGLPMRAGRIRAGGGGLGSVEVLKRGWVSHRREANVAGYHDRSDPGPLLDWPYIRHAALFYIAHGGFWYRRDGRKVQA